MTSLNLRDGVRNGAGSISGTTVALLYLSKVVRSSKSVDETGHKVGSSHGIVKLIEHVVHGVGLLDCKEGDFTDHTCFVLISNYYNKLDIHNTK